MRRIFGRTLSHRHCIKAIEHREVVGDDTFMLLITLLSSIFLHTQFVHAQVDVTQTGTAHLYVEQNSDLEAVGSWTLIYPNNETMRRLDATLDIPDLPPGNYTFIATPPKGTSSTTELFLGDDVISSQKAPQLSFTLKENMTATLRITYALTVFGKVGVNSMPSGVPFTLRGPDNMTVTGVTPQEYARMPIGNYSVTYRPKGCHVPPSKSAVLEQNNRADFMIELACDTLEQQQSSQSSHMTVAVGSANVIFTDVDPSAWYAPYVSTVVSEKLLAGYTDSTGQLTGRFGPSDPVTPAQLSKILHQLMGLRTDVVTRAPWNTTAFGTWFTRYQASAEERGWTLYLDPALDLQRPMTRGEVMMTLLQVIDVPLQWTTGDVFTDVKRFTPYASAIETAQHVGIISGSVDANGAQVFQPEAHVTRAELSKILITVREKFLKRQQN
jgi:hypothetical protein